MIYEDDLGRIRLQHELLCDLCMCVWLLCFTHTAVCVLSVHYCY